MIAVLIAIGIIWMTVKTSMAYVPNRVAPREFPAVIACINQVTWEIRKPLNDSESACFHWQNWKNLRFPSRSQLTEMRKVFRDRASLVTAITLINHESQFNSKAKWCHRWGCDYGLFQIRDVNWWKKMTDKQQMEWFYKRKTWQLSSSWNCHHRVVERNHEKILRCIFARHHWDLLWTAQYPTARLQEWKFYNSIKF